MDDKMILTRNLWCLLLVATGVTHAFTNVPEGGCDLSFTQPCRSNSSLCVPHQHVRDGFIDCPDGSDEDCPDDWFICSDLSRCIDRQFIQDGVPECDDESDEACDEWQHECLCGFPRCIDKALVGDGNLDCSEGSDELAIEKKSYICPYDLLTGQDLLRKKRQLEQEDRRNVGKGIVTNFYTNTQGASLGVLTSTVFSFVNKGTTSEYLTQIEGKTIDGRYAQVTSVTSRTFFALPTRLNKNQVNGLVSSIVKTTISSGYTTTIVSRIYHTNIDGTYAQLVETETIGYVPTKTVSMNIVTILQGQELHGTLISYPDNSIATLQFSHLEGSLNPEPVAQEIVTVTGTYGKFIRDGFNNAVTTYSVFTGSYVKDFKTYVFFFGNSALPSEHHSLIEGGSVLKMKQGFDKKKIILDMEKDMEVIMPSELKMLEMGSKNDLLIGEGMVDGHKVDGLFIADSEGFDVIGAKKSGEGSLKMLTVTIGQPSTVANSGENIATKVNENFSFFDEVKSFGNEEENELDTSLLRGRKVDINGNEVFAETDKINPTRPLPQDIPTFVIEEPDQHIADIILREQIMKQNSDRAPQIKVKEEIVIENNEDDKFNIFSILQDSELPTVTYYGFADFTTTIENTVVVFTPNSRSNAHIDTETKSLKPRVIPTKATTDIQANGIHSAMSTFSTVTTKVFNTVDLYPSGLVSSIGGTFVNDDITTLFTTLVYGTYIQGQYAQVVRSTSSIIYLVSKQPSSLEPTKLMDITMTKSPLFDLAVSDKSHGNIATKSSSLFDSLFNNLQEDNALGRSVAGEARDQNVITDDEKMKKDMGKPGFPVTNKQPSTVTYTLYTTYMKDETTSVVTNYKITTVSPQFGTITKFSPTTLTHHTTHLIKGATKVQSSLEVVQSSVPPPSSIDNLFSDIFGSDSHASTNEDVSHTFSESVTESSAQSTTESPEVSLDSSLNPEEDVNALFFPRTYYTTYTYFTTYHRLNTSSIVSSLDTVTNIITDEKQLEDYKALTPAIPTYPVTYWTTYTYWTTLVKDNSSIVTSSKKTISNVVNLTANETPTVVNEVLPIDATAIVPLIDLKQTPTVDMTTYYTTYTYYTTATIGESTVITSRHETESSVVTGTRSSIGQTNVIERPFGLLFDQSVTETSTFANHRTGLLSTIRGSTVIGGTTTVFSTNVYGTFVDGLYVQIQSTTNEILATSSILASEGKRGGVLTVDAGSIIENDVTTHYTTQTVGAYIKGIYMTKLLSTSRLDGTMSFITETNPTQTGIVREIIGSVIYGTKTTFYHSTVLGTLIDGIYAQKIESTSRFVSGPSIAFDVLTDQENMLSFESVSPITILESSIQSAINPTPVLFATESLESLKSETTHGEVMETPKHKNRLSFPIRTSSKRRTDEFPFIKRTSTFSKEEALSKVFAAAPEEETSLAQKSTTKSKTSKTEQEPTQSFRFGNVNTQPTRRFRFQEKGQSKVEPTVRVPFTQEKSMARSIKPAEDDNKLSIQEKPKHAVEKIKPIKEEPESEHVEEHDTFRQFRFGAKASTNGTRSTLPFPKRKLNDTIEIKKPTASVLPNLPQSTTAKPKITTKETVSDASKSKRPNPFSFPTRTEDKRKSTRPTKPEPADRGSFNNILRPKPIPTTSPAPKTTRGPRPRLGGLLPRRRPAIPKLNEGESVIDTVYINEDGTEVLEEDLPGSIDYANGDVVYDDAIYEYDEPLTRKKRQVDDFGSRTTSRGAKRFARNQESNSDLSNISPSAPKNEKQAFTLSNPRLSAARIRTRARPSSPSKVAKPERPGPPVRSPVSRLSPSKSRTSLPFKPRENNLKVALPVETLQRGTFRRPESNSRFKISNRFTPDEKINSNNQARRPSVHTANRNRVVSRPPPSKNNPIQSFLDRPKPQPKLKEPESMSKFDGVIDITDTLTVTREVPVTTTIPLLENGETIEKEVITASYTTELIFPDQVTRTEINGVIKYLLSTVESKQKVTRVFIQPIVTTFVTYTPVFLDGQRTSISHVIPSTIYNIVTATGPKNGNDVQDLLKLLLLQQQQQNPLLAALGIGGQQPSVHLHTKTIVTTVTSLTSTEIPIIFRGKPIRTTVVETNVREVTTIEISTETLLGQGSNHNPLGQILPLILQNQLNRKAREISQTEIPTIENIEEGAKLKDKYYPVYIDEDGVRPLADLESIFNYESHALHINSAINEIEANEYVEATPPLRNVYEAPKESLSRNSFLSNGPAEFTPLRRKVRSAQRGDVRQRGPVRQLGSRKIKTSADDQILQDISGAREKDVINNNRAPTTFFTTFTYYTTLIDDLDREFVQSSEETITQVATFGNIKFDDFTRTKPTSVQPIVHTSIEMFKPEDAIIPGKPRPVPDPIFKEPEPPHGPIIRHGSVTARRRGRPGKSDALKINLKGQSTNIGLSMPVTVLPRDSDSADTIVDGVLQSLNDLSPTHEVMELEETDVDQPISGRPGEQKRVRITLTKRKPVHISNTADIVDQTTVDAGGRKRVVITRRLPQTHATAVASPVDPFMGTVNTFYTVYSYVYSLYENAIPFSVSTRVVTVSNAVQRTQVAVPLRFQTIQPTSNLYTIEEGQVVATLGERIKNGYTTQIYLHSATLASIRPGVLQRPTIVINTLKEQPIFDYDTVESTGLQSSLQEVENTLATSTPLFIRHSSRKTQRGPLIKAPTRLFSKDAAESFTVNKSSLNVASDVTQTRKRGDIRFANNLSKSHINPAFSKELSLSSARRNQLNTQRRRPSTATTESIDTTEAEIEAALENLVKKVTLERENRPVAPEKPVKKSNLPDIFANIFDTVEEISTEKQATSFVGKQSSIILPTEVPSTFSTEDEKHLSSTASITTELPSTIKSPRPSVRRNDIPIVRRPSLDGQSKDNVANHRLRFTTTHKTIGGSATSSTEGTPLTSPLSIDDVKEGLHQDEYYDNEYYDEYDYNATSNARDEMQPTEIDNLADKFKEDVAIVSDKKEKGGRAVIGSIPPDQIIGGSPSPVGSFLSISGRQNLATKVMNNGVEVIVAEDKAKTDPSITGLVRATVNDIRRPITLPPSTLSNQMLLLASTHDEQMFQTYYTTFTYYNTLMSDGKPTVISSRETISNIISTPYELSGNYIEKTKINLATSTYLTTQTYTRTVGNLFNPETITSEEVITQVVVTEAPSVSRSRVQDPPAVTTLVSKTYFTTFTYYRTYVNEHDTSIDTETVVSSDVVTETSVTFPKSKHSAISITKAPETIFDEIPVEIYATKTYYTTSTYFTTILEGDATLTASHIEVTSNVHTEPVTTVLRTNDLLAISKNIFNDVESSHNTDNYESTKYISLRNNVYKQLRTLFATFTHYTTLIGGEVHSNEVTKTQILTSIITTTSVPSSLLVKPDRTFTNIEATSTSNKLFAEGLFDTLFGTTSSVDLEPSYIESTSQLGVSGTSNVGHVNLHSSADLKESSGQATVHVEEGDESGTFVVKDSTTSATLLVRPTEEISSSLNLFDQLFTSKDSEVEEASKPIVFLASSQLPVVETTVPPVRSDLELTSSEVSQVPSLSSVRLDSPPSTPVVEEAVAADSIDEASADKDPQSDSDNKFGFGFKPMLTAAVAGLIGNTFAGRLAGQAAVGNRRKGDHILPKNAIVAAENEPLFIPIGGVGASISKSHSETMSPDNGFIPLRQQFQQSVEENPAIVDVQTHSTVSVDSFGPAFRPPLTTQTGFTAMTKDISPTKVSIISGEETIFFGGFKNLNLPPPGEPVMHKEIQNNEDLRPHPVPLSIDVPSEKSISHFSLTTSETQQIDHKVRPAPRPSLIQFDLEDGGENIYASETDHDHQVEIAPIELQSTLNNGDEDATIGPVGGTGILSTDLPFRFKSEGDRTTIVKGSSTVMSGDTTIFDSLFTKPAKDNTQSLSVSVVRGLNGKLTKYITRTEDAANTIVTTKTHYDFIDGFPISRTEVITHTRGLKTLVSTIVDSKTQVNELVSKTSIANAIKPTAISESKTRLTTVTVTPAKDNDANLIPNVADFPEANLGYAEENEISRVVESKSPDQDLSQLSGTDRCNSRCGKDEICGSFDQDHVCVCKPRYSRRNPNDVCKKSKSFQVTVQLDRLNDNKLSFSAEMTNSSHPNTQFLINEVKSGIDKALMDSDLGNKYHSNTILSFEETTTDQLAEPSLIARVKVDLADDETEEEVSFSSFIPFARKNKVNELSVQSALEESFAGSNYSIGGGEVFARQAALNAEDFDECESREHNDCHINAECINTAGSFACVCKETFIDASNNKNKEPGRQCIESNTCRYCNFHGKCEENSRRELSCVCNDWFSGEHCDVNMKVMLIAVVSVGAFLLVLLAIFICFCCCRSKDNKEQPPFIRASTGRREPSTLDRRAMIHDTSSECSEEVIRRPSAALLDASKLPPMPRTPQADYSVGRRSGISSMSKDRSVTVHTSVPPVLIPRIKGYNNQALNRSYVDKENLKTAEATLVDILDGTHDIVPNPSVHSFSRIPQINHKSRSRERIDEDVHHHHTSRYQHRHGDDEEPSVRSRSNSRPRYHPNDGSTFRSRSTDRLDRSTQDLTSDFEGNSLRYGNRTVSQARSYDETTIRPPIRSFKNESFRSRDISSQVISDGMPTNAERDGNSTIVYPPMQLYRPVREADSMSDLTSHPKNDFF